MFDGELANETLTGGSWSSENTGKRIGNAFPFGVVPFERIVRGARSELHRCRLREVGGHRYGSGCSGCTIREQQFATVWVRFDGILAHIDESEFSVDEKGAGNVHDF